MRSFTYTEHIERSPQDVFAFMMDFSKAPRWRTLVRRIEVVGGGAMRQGAELLLTLDVMGNSRQYVSEVWAFEPPRRVGYRNTASNVSGTFEYILQPESTGTRITMSCDVRPHGMMWLALPWLLRGNRARYRDQLANLKREVEKQTGGL
jgi:hypothetical protein